MINTIRLLAISSSGEAYYTQDQNGIIELHSRLGNRSAIKVDSYVVNRAITDFGWTPINEDFATLIEVDAAVQKQIATSEWITSTPILTKETP